MGIKSKLLTRKLPARIRLNIPLKVQTSQDGGERSRIEKSNG